ncbi:MAG TPA: hypothetical protein VHM67_02410, partial [Gemmatimonadaceae bacterium]|nr:hypothetical protein [Gemmatimonadaceae bacterium]
TCNSLRAKLDAARNSIIAGNSRAAAGQIGALLNELEAQRNEKVNERAYMLLSTNAEYLLGRL